jgi:hypothetical protein
MFPYSHEVLNSLMSAPNAVSVKAMLLQQPKSTKKKKKIIFKTQDDQHGLK